MTEFETYIAMLPPSESNPDTITNIEADMKSRINSLGFGFTYTLKSNENQDSFHIKIGNIDGKQTEIQFDGTTGETLTAVNNYIYLRMLDPRGEFYLKEENLPGYDAGTTMTLQDDINAAIEAVRKRPL